MTPTTNGLGWSSIFLGIYWLNAGGGRARFYCDMRKEDKHFVTDRQLWGLVWPLFLSTEIIPPLPARSPEYTMCHSHHNRIILIFWARDTRTRAQVNGGKYCRYHFIKGAHIDTFSVTKCDVHGPSSCGRNDVIIYIRNVCFIQVLLINESEAKYKVLFIIVRLGFAYGKKSLGDRMFILITHTWWYRRLARLQNIVWTRLTMGNTVAITGIFVNINSTLYRRA